MPWSAGNERNAWMLRQDSSMLSGSAHWERIEANDRPVLPSAGPPNASTTRVRKPDRAR
jgi:hypothetical protein